MLDTTQFSNDQTVAFGAGLRRNFAEHLRTSGYERPLILTTPQQCELGLELAEILGASAAGVFSKATMHTPTDVTDEALVHLRDVKADSVLSIGGGSTIGLGKALVLHTDIGHIALPTTYAGSECTPILGQTENGVKTTMTDPKLRPGIVLYDAELVATLPAAMTITSALNAMAHAVEALYAKDRTETATQLALEGIAAFQTSLPAVMENPGDLAARQATQEGAWACGTVLGQVGMALHHKLCHTLGGSLNLPHAETHAIVLPHATAFNQPAAAEELAPLADLFGASDLARALWDFAKSLDAPTALKDLGVEEADLDRVADLATQNPYRNPREITKDGIRALLGRAWEGAAPQA
ncbi:maleylacetate reductase [Jannaschia pagri]|uniref:Maleylacetate reductase n=1 Tax=Jannaschia pagri TaxID=2829797 RepID=A0ABQ4NIW2_9RHOB|nr:MULTISPECIES: maleylacetate reductase [unclassified Jannaschia]GIT90524.1 maleylacetate reductase [Jannaschia sp. AI_61]GIT94356.1 maleylacetate reductase [Jannaschia sp. AI_62]